MKNNKSYIFAGCFILILLSLACGQVPQASVPVEGWPEVTTRLAAEATTVALTPTVAAVGSTTIQIVASDPQDALRQIKNALASNPTYATVNITVTATGGTVVLTAIYEAERTRSVVWGGDWRPTLFTMETTATEWVGDKEFWGEWSDTP